MFRISWRSMEMHDLGLCMVGESPRLRAGRYSSLGMACGLSPAEVGDRGSDLVRWEWSLLPERAGDVTVTIGEYARQSDGGSYALVHTHVITIHVAEGRRPEPPREWLVQQGDQLTLLTQVSRADALRYVAGMVASPSAAATADLYEGWYDSNGLHFKVPAASGLAYAFRRDVEGSVYCTDLASDREDRIVIPDGWVAEAGVASPAFAEDRTLQTDSAGRHLAIANNSREVAMWFLIRTAAWAKPGGAEFTHRLHLLRPVSDHRTEVVISDEVSRHPDGSVSHRNVTSGAETVLTGEMARRNFGPWVAELIGPPPVDRGLSL